MVVSASSDTTLKVWDLVTGRELCTLEGHSAPVGSVALSPDHRLAISGSADKTLRLWDLESGHEIRAFGSPSERVELQPVNFEGDLALGRSPGDETLRLWNLRNKDHVRTLIGSNSDWVTSLGVSWNARRVVSGSFDGTIRIWDLDTGCNLRAWSGHVSRVQDLAISPDQRRFVSSSWDKTVKVWNFAGTQIAEFTCEGNVNSCLFVSDDLLIAGDTGGHVHFLRLEQAHSNT